ncbi:MAG TPA: molybdate ABC transporter substrate-binding protein [Candidatus Saccharimonadales bacterium]|nr:molybdate ABC transporter substrate-binding protein [Candidatus Saccharimonadales bacterium]
MKNTRIKVAWVGLAAAVLLAPFFAARAAIESMLPQVPAKPCGTVTVAAASDLTFAMNEIAGQYQKASGCSVQLSMGSSGNFLTQIENGAPFDVFFSADIAYPKKLEAESLAAPGSTYLYAIGKIVLWARNDSGVNVSKGFSALQDSAVRKIAIANPAHAPYGRAAEGALRKAGVYDSVKSRLVLGENISQAAEFVESGNADAGILALSLVLSPTMKDKGRSWNIPENLYAPIEQGAVVVLSSKNQQGAKNFLEYIKLPETAALLARYGFARPANASSGGRH